MVDVRHLLAAVLGVGLGAVLLFFPEAVIRVHTVGRMPHDRTGEYGEEGSAPTLWRRGVQAAGVVSLVAGIYFGATTLAIL